MAAAAAAAAIKSVVKTTCTPRDVYVTSLQTSDAATDDECRRVTELGDAMI